MSERRVVLTSRRDDDGLVHREVRLRPDGALLVVGHDLGPGVERWFGDEEYEFVRTIAAEQVPRLLESLGAEPGADPLVVIEERFTDTSQIEKHLAEHGIETSLWSRVGS